MLNLALIGFGRMGQTIAQIAPNDQFKIISTIDPQANGTTHSELDSTSLSDVDVAIDFSSPESTLANLEILAQNQINAIIGTTGWYDSLDEAQRIVKQGNIGVLWSSNFSIGVNLFWKILEHTASLMNQFPEYDIFGHEIHHVGKKDSPSGTAHTLSQILLDHLDRKEKVVTETLNRQIQPNEFHFSSTRGGHVPGWHQICFDSNADTITLQHSARNRSGFALGALTCAKWLQNRQGFFTMQDYLKTIIPT